MMNGRSLWRGMIGALILVASAQAQYVQELEAVDEEAGIRYFGSAKDEKGRLLPNVTFLIESKLNSYIFVTGPSGRFRGNLPLDLTAGTVEPRCWKKGFSPVRITKRVGANAKRPAVQVDCVLRSGSVTEGR